MTNHIRDIKESINSCLTPFFSGGNTVTINSVDVTFYDCEIKYGIERLRDSFTGKPLIVIFSAEEQDRKTLKCNGKFRHELMLRSRVVVKVADRQVQTDLNGDIIGATEKAHEVWSQLFLVVETQEDRFDAYNIRHVNLDSSPSEIRHEEHQESLVTGYFGYEYTGITVGHDAFVAP